ncbi:MAG: hypothetical protein ABI763_07450 [Bacteroidota bacterium]
MKIISYLTLCSVLIFSSCSKKEDDNSSPSNNNNNGGSTSLTIDSHWQVKAKIDGVDYAKVDGNGANGVFSDGGETAADPDSSISNYGSTLMDGTLTIPYFEVVRNGHHFLGGAEVENVDFLAFFQPGTYPFTPELVSGVAIHYTDASGEMWGTDMGSANQTGSEFKIIQVREETVFPDYDLKVLSHFHCKLYNVNGQSKTLTDGEYVSLFEAL